MLRAAVPMATTQRSSSGRSRASCCPISAPIESPTTATGGLADRLDQPGGVRGEIGYRPGRRHVAHGLTDPAVVERRVAERGLEGRDLVLVPGAAEPAAPGEPDDVGTLTELLVVERDLGKAQCRHRPAP